MQDRIAPPPPPRRSLPAPPAPPAPAAVLLGRSPAMVRLRVAIAQLAAQAAPVLLLGETGTGKELVGRALAALRPGGGPFVPVNCGALGPEMVASELFGHERGAFTGAHQRRLGAFEAAAAGTLFLDELGELPLAVQPQLLRALENGEVRRLGADQVRRCTPRVVAATHCELPEAVRAGRFRADLFYRLHVLVLRLPPLRARLEDLEVLVPALLLSLPGGAAATVTAAAWRALRAHPWPGNVRELRNVLQRALVFGAGAALDAEHLDFGAPPGPAAAPPPRTVRGLERAAIVAELRHAAGNRTAAAAALGLSRSTLHRRLRALGAAAPAATPSAP